MHAYFLVKNTIAPPDVVDTLGSGVYSSHRNTCQKLYSWMTNTIAPSVFLCDEYNFNLECIHHTCISLYQIQYDFYRIGGA